MQRTDLHAMIGEALGQQWAIFAEHHPLLASVIDKDLATERCMRDLREDPELREATSQVEMAGLAQEALQGIVVKLVKRWMTGV